MLGICFVINLVKKTSVVHSLLLMCVTSFFLLSVVATTNCLVNIKSMYYGVLVNAVNVVFVYELRINIIIICYIEVKLL